MQYQIWSHQCISMNFVSNAFFSIKHFSTCGDRFAYVSCLLLPRRFIIIYFFLFITDYELMTFGISLDLSGVKMKMKNWSAYTAEKLNYPVEDRSVFEIHWIYVWSENDTELHKSFLGCFESFLAKFTGQT